MNDNNSSQHRPRRRALAYPWLFTLSLSLVGVPTEKVSADEVFVGAGDIAGFWT